MSGLSAEELTAIRTRTVAAGEGPVKLYEIRELDHDGDIAFLVAGSEWLAEFLRHAREDVPRLLDALTEAHAEIERLQSEVELGIYQQDTPQ